MQNTDEQDVIGGLEEVKTGRGSAGLVRGGEGKHRTDETSRKGKGKGSEGKGEHGSKGGAGSNGRQQVENLVVDGVRENMRAMKSEEEEENHREDVRKLVEMMQKEKSSGAEWRWWLTPAGHVGPERRGNEAEMGRL